MAVLARCHTAAVVVTLLLLLAGDVETNPGPGAQSPEYSAVVECTSELTATFREGVADISDSLFSHGLISAETHQNVLNPNVSNRASQLVASVIDRIKRNPAIFEKLISILEEQGPWTDDVVKHLLTTYERKNEQSPEYLTLAECTPVLTATLQQDIQKGHAISDGLRANGLISDDIYQEMVNPYVSNRASKQVASARTSIRTPSAFKTIISILKQQGPWTNDVVEHLLTTYERKKDPSVEDSGVQRGPSTPIDLKSGAPQPTPTAQQGAHCIIPESPLPMGQSSIGNEAAGGITAIGKLWPRGNRLSVFFMNPGELKKIGLNVLNIMQWAEVWDRGDQYVPTFIVANSIAVSHIRVWIQVGEGSETYIGTDASKHPSDPSMKLGLLSNRNDYNRHIVIHEFGHALGLLHEHQRSCFLDVAKKYLDMDPSSDNKIRRALNMKRALFKRDFVKTMVGDGGDYDPDSIMHYWFKVQWFKDEYLAKGYANLSVIEADMQVPEEEKVILRGIHARDEYSLVLTPSAEDHKILAKNYREAHERRPGNVETGWTCIIF